MLSYVGIGSNQAQPIKQAKQALTALNNIKGTTLVACSSLYSSKPMGPQDQPDYVNAVAILDTKLTAFELLDALQKIEQEQGRIRKENRWGPRTLDLDILLYGDQIINDDCLTVPHYGMKDREFVLHPLFEISPELQFPDGTYLRDIIKECNKNGLAVITS
jgi:2-amino-4-hydroxy-6-hydroxymethyldihydropteridine diphosphokinase